MLFCLWRCKLLGSIGFYDMTLKHRSILVINVLIKSIISKQEDLWTENETVLLFLFSAQSRGDKAQQAIKLIQCKILDKRKQKKGGKKLIFKMKRQHYLVILIMFFALRE